LCYIAGAVADQDQKTKKDAPAKDAPASKRLEVKAVQLGGESIVDRLLPHIKKIAWMAGGIAAIAIVVFTVMWLKERSQEKKTTKLVTVLDVAERPIRPAGEPENPEQATFASASDRANAILDAMAKADTDATGPVYKATLLMQVGKYDEAAALYRKQQGAKGLDGVIAREGLGLALEQKATAEKDATARQKGLEEALAEFQKMQPNEDGPRREYALYHQGRVLALLGKTAEAKDALNKAKALSKDNDELTSLVDERLASLGAS
jgi:tetratricopeptide (TPR) repeat protein